MPRLPRIDYPGALHHVMGRGIRRERIFHDDQDREAFTGRLGGLLLRTGTTCLAWSLLPNHFHLLLRTGRRPLAWVMHRLLLWYALRFNRRQGRDGHVFQNRYQSVLCEAERYLLELVRYVHLNPLRAGIVGDLEELEAFRWSGHRAVVAGQGERWEAVPEVLAEFSREEERSRVEYRRFVAEGVGLGERRELEGGGIFRSVGGRQEVAARRRAGQEVKGDERILGRAEFTERALARAGMGAREVARGRGRAAVVAAVAEAAKAMRVPAALVYRGSRKRRVARARALACRRLVEDVGMPGVEVARHLGVTAAAVSQGVERGLRLTGKEQGKGERK